jgi:hypothetical protein
MDGSRVTKTTDGEGGWVDSVVAETAIKDSDLARLDLTKDFDDILARIFESDVRGEIAPLRRRGISRKTGTLAIVAVIAVGGAAAAAAVKGGALTGLFGAPGSTENDISEYVNIAAPNFPSLAHQLGDQLHSTMPNAATRP